MTRSQRMEKIAQAAEERARARVKLTNAIVFAFNANQSLAEMLPNYCLQAISELVECDQKMQELIGDRKDDNL